MILCRRRRWGVFVMPLFWLIAALGAVLAWSVRRDLKAVAHNRKSA